MRTGRPPSEASVNSALATRLSGSSLIRALAGMKERSVKSAIQMSPRDDLSLKEMKASCRLASDRDSKWQGINTSQAAHPARLPKIKTR